MIDYSKRKCYGFIRDKGSGFIIDEKQAKTVRFIFESFENGLSLNKIAEKLHKLSIPSPSGNEKWSRKVISSTLSNEKYATYKIISKQLFNVVQDLKRLRSRKKSKVEEPSVIEVNGVNETNQSNKTATKNLKPSKNSKSKKAKSKEKEKEINTNKCVTKVKDISKTKEVTTTQNIKDNKKTKVFSIFKKRSNVISSVLCRNLEIQVLEKQINRFIPNIYLFMLHRYWLRCLSNMIKLY